MPLQSPRSVIPLPTGSVQRPARPEPCLGLLVENNIREPRQAGSVVRDALLGSRAGLVPSTCPVPQALGDCRINPCHGHVSAEAAGSQTPDFSWVCSCRWCQQCQAPAADVWASELSCSVLYCGTGTFIYLFLFLEKKSCSPGDRSIRKAQEGLSYMLGLPEF